MAAPHLPRTDRDFGVTDPPPMADSIGAFGWLCLFLIAVGAFLLLTNF
jgi:hypothetical protein